MGSPPADIVHQAAEQAGLPAPIVVSAAEATAAHAATATPIEAGSHLLVCDFGDRASSITVLARAATGWQTLATIPSQATGTTIDEGVLARLDFDDNLREKVTGSTTGDPQVHAKLLAAVRVTITTSTDGRAAILQQWIVETQAEKAVAETALRAADGRRGMTTEEIRTLVEAMSGIAAILKAAHPADKAELYRELGLRLTYEPGPA